MRLRIVSSGTTADTSVMTEDGTPIDGVVSVTWSAAMVNGEYAMATATFEVENVPVTVVGEVAVG